LFISTLIATVQRWPLNPEIVLLVSTESGICKGFFFASTRVGTLIVATIYLQLIQNRYMF